MNEWDLLPESLKAQSLSDDEVVLPLEGARAALEILEKEGFLLLCWEGWLQYADGAVGHSLSHQGSTPIRRHPEEAWEDFTRRAGESFLRSASAAAQAFSVKPENPGAQLYFCLSFLHIDD